MFVLHADLPAWFESFIWEGSTAWGNPDGIDCVSSELVLCAVLQALPDPNNKMSMNIPQATLNPVKNVLSLFLRIVLKISCHLSRSNMGVYVFYNLTILQVDLSIGQVGDIGLVRNDDDGNT